MLAVLATSFTAALSDPEECEHCARCTNPGMCDVCAAPYDGEVFHYGDGEYVIGGDWHRTHCADCGAVIAAQEVIPALPEQWMNTTRKEQTHGKEMA